MDNAMANNMNVSDVASDLRRRMRGAVVVYDPARETQSEMYETARRVWNGAVDRRPALIALCETVEDVQAAVAAARLRGLALSVRGGGHDWAGRALADGGLTVDLSRMRQVAVDGVARTATVAGGATAADVIAAGAPYGLVAVTGTVGAVGMTGLTLGGGYGSLTPRYGLALDNMLGADIVLADGRHIATDAEQHPDLFWALRGGGGNFGVVTAMRLRLHEIRQVLAGFLIFPWSEAEAVLRRYADLAGDAPDELGIIAGVLSAPNGDPVIFVAPVWSGALARGQEIVAALMSLGTPLMAQTGAVAYGGLLSQFDATVVPGRHYDIKTRWLPALSSEAIAAILSAGAAKTSPFSAIALHHFRGAAARVPPAATAFGLRREHYLVEVIAAWEPANLHEADIHRQWAKDSWQRLGSIALPGGYPNLLGPSDHEQAESAYGPNATRLIEAKRRYDPHGLFTSATPLPR